MQTQTCVSFRGDRGKDCREVEPVSPFLAFLLSYMSGENGELDSNQFVPDSDPNQLFKRLVEQGSKSNDTSLKNLLSTLVQKNSQVSIILHADRDNTHK